MDEKGQTMKKQWLTNFELQEIQKKTGDESHGQEMVECKSD